METSVSTPMNTSVYTHCLLQSSAPGLGGAAGGPGGASLNFHFWGRRAACHRDAVTSACQKKDSKVQWNLKGSLPCRVYSVLHVWITFWLCAGVKPHSSETLQRSPLLPSAYAFLICYNQLFYGFTKFWKTYEFPVLILILHLKAICLLR